MEKELMLDSLNQVEKEFIEDKKIFNPEYPITAMEAFHKYQGAIPFFELGIKLGRIDPVIAEKLIINIKDQLNQNLRELEEQLYPTIKRGF